jgi:serine/threonine-protein kinase
MSTDPDPLGADPTGGLEPAVARSHSLGGSFGRYRDLRLLGTGGMATVYKAHDPSLDRTVALKLLRFEDPQLVERLLFEARAQARIQHEHVCPIYEAGAESGRAYIAMRFVDGQTLSDACEGLSLEQKLTLMKDVAEGLHAAHRVGLVHRDLKPSNVMVERTADGGWHPYVLDFGLAREVDAPGLTQTGALMGTPSYMSPEQARGDSRVLDRRSDVYSLGATLYKLLSGTLPFEAESAVGVLVRIVQEEPVSVGARNSTIPVDVQSIVMKCLEKEPARRYDSARALAEDIGRYLNGEATLARRSGIIRRAWKRTRKHRWAVAAGAVALLLAGSSALFALRARSEAAAAARLASEFGQSVRDVEWILRVAHMAPLHDTRGEKARVRQRLTRIEDRMREVGTLATGPGEYALGRGELALGDLDAARRHLELAWTTGFRAPEVAYALGLALGGIYQRELALASSGSAELRESRHRELQAAYRDRAVAYLRQSAGTDVAVPEYVEGLLAFYEKRYDDALAKADAALARASWLFEARLVQGEVHAVLARARHETGDSRGYLESLAAAEAAYGHAAEFARSNPEALEGLCQIAVQRMESTLYERGDLDPLYDAAREACERVLATDGERAETHAKLANIHRFWANHLILDGQSPLAALDRAAARAREAIRLDPRNRRGHGNLGVVYRLRAQYELDHGLPSAGSLQSAIESLTAAVELSGADAGALNDLGNAYSTRADADEASGKDVRPDLAAAVSHYDGALERVPDFAYAHANKGHVLTRLAAHELKNGHDPSRNLEGAVASLERATQLLPKAEGTHTRLASARTLEAEWRLSRGDDPSAPLAVAKAELAEAARINPRPGPDVLIVAGRVALVEAGRRVASGRTPGAALDEARRRFRTAAAIDRNAREAARRLEDLERLEARWRAGPSRESVAR